MSSIVIEFDAGVRVETMEKMLIYIGDAIKREVTAGGIPGSRYDDQGYCRWELLMKK